MNEPRLNLPPLTLRDLPHLFLMGAFVFLTATHFQLPWFLEGYDTDQPDLQAPVLAPLAAQSNPMDQIKSHNSFSARASDLSNEPRENLGPARDEVVDETPVVVEAFEPNT